MFQFPWSASAYPMYSGMSNCELPQLGFPIRTPPDQSLLTAPRGSFVVRHVLRRLLAPRHPPCALISLTNAPVFRLFAPLGLRSCSWFAPFTSGSPPKSRCTIENLRFQHTNNYFNLFTQVSAKRCSKTHFRFGIQFSRIKVYYP